MLRAASVGLGWWSDELAGAVQGRSTEIAIVSCFSRSAEKRSSFASKFKTGTHDSYAGLLSDPGIDAVILTTPHSLHARHVTQAAEAGKHIFVEKPFTLTAESGKAAAAACASAGVALCVGHNRRFSSAAGELRRMREEGEFGTLLHVEANFSAPGGLSYTADRWRASRVESPAGGIAGLGIHLIDIMCWIAGPVAKVTAQATRRAVPVDIDDTTSALFAFASGATGYLGCSFACPYTCCVNVYGTKANAFAQIDGDQLDVQLPGGSRSPTGLSKKDTIRAELEEFAMACRGDRVFRVDPAEATSNVAVMEAIAESAASGTAVAIDDDIQAAWLEQDK